MRHGASASRSHERVEEGDDEETEPMTERVKWAISMLEELGKDIEVLIDHFHTALGEV